jgi:hypothetical protein
MMRIPSSTKVPMQTPSTTSRYQTTQPTAPARLRRLAAWLCLCFALCLDIFASPAAHAQTNLPVVIADFNHDGIPDVLVPTDSGPAATIAFGTTPFGTFSSNPRVVNFPTACSGFFPDLSLGQLIAGDFNGDGFPDLFFLCGASSTGILLGAGDGTFAAPSLISLSGVTSIAGAAAGDFNHDGKLDIALIGSPNGGQTTGILFFSGNGDGTFAAPVYSAFGTTTNFSPTQSSLGMLAVDLNGDGYPDIVINGIVAESSAVLSVFGNNKDGTFGTASQSTRIPSTSVVLGTSAAVHAFTIQTANLFGGTSPDLLLSSSGSAPGAVLVKNTSSSSTFSFANPVTNTYAGYKGVLAGNFTGTIYSDLAISNGTTISVLANDGTGNFSTSYSTLTIASTDALLAAADANGDGYTDIYSATLQTSGALQLGVQLVNGTATATSQPVSLTASGTQALSATWPGNPVFTGSTATGSQTVNGTAATSLISSSLNPSTAGAPVTLSVLVSPPANLNGVPTPSGTVILTDGTNMLGSGSLNDSGIFQVTTSALPTGTHSVLAQYSGDTFYAASTSVVFSQVVNPQAAIAPTITWTTPASISYGTPLSPIQLNATAANAQGVPIPGAFIYTPAAGAILTAGTQTLSVLFTPTDTVTYSTATATVTLTVVKAAPATLLTLSATTVPLGSPVTFTAAVVQGALPITVGQVNLCDAAASFCTEPHLLGTAQLTSAGTAIFKFMPGIGTHTYKAVFAGTTSAAAATSATATLTVTGSYPTTTTIAQSGSVGNYTLNATVLGTGGGASLPPTGTVSFLNTTNGSSLVGVATLGSSVAGISFKGVVGPIVGENPQHRGAVGDFNGDGILDIATANTAPESSQTIYANTVTISLGNGDGTFTTLGTSPATGRRPESIVTGDFNGDGKLDLAAANQTDGTVTILLGNGDGTFTAAVSPEVGTSPFGMIAGDFNGDGNLDLAVSEANGISILLGKGDGTFTQLFTSTPGYGAEIVTADFNGDGKADLAVQSNSPPTYQLLVLLGNGDGTFTSSATISEANSGSNRIAVGDFNGDGKEDLAVTAYGANKVTILISNGDGTFTASTAASAINALPIDIRTADFNGDGKLDLAVVNFGEDTARETVLLGNGDGTFTTPAISTGVYAYDALAVGDFNGDGVPDLASTTGGSSLDIALTQLSQTAVVSLSNVSIVGTGPYQVVASYPADANYAASVSTPTALTGQAIAPTVTWVPAVATIPYGTPLSAQQLDAAATGLAGVSLPGAFTYTPSAGTVLSLGAHTLSVLFMPTDLVDYTPLTATAQVTVTAPTLTALTPATVPLGSAATTIALTGTGFVPTSVVLLNGTAIATTYVSPVALTAIIPAASLTQAATLQLAVSTPALTLVTPSLPFTVSVAAPNVTVTAPSTTQPGTQPGVTLALTNPYPVPLTATFTLSFSSAVSTVTDDPSIQFATGGRTATFVIPANTVSAPAIQLQAGTVAGTITIPLTLTANGVNVTPTPQPTVTITIPRAVPTLSTTAITRATGQLSVAIHGFSNTRDVTTATFHFTAAPGATIDTPDITAPVTPLFTTWFASAASDPYGSTFTYTQVFDVSDDPANIGSVTVTLTNSVGTSTTETAQ